MFPWRNILISLRPDDVDCLLQFYLTTNDNTCGWLDFRRANFFPLFAGVSHQLLAAPLLPNFIRIRLPVLCISLTYGGRWVPEYHCFFNQVLGFSRNGWSVLLCLFAGRLASWWPLWLVRNRMFWRTGFYVFWALICDQHACGVFLRVLTPGIATGRIEVLCLRGPVVSLIVLSMLGRFVVHRFANFAPVFRGTSQRRRICSVS